MLRSIYVGVGTCSLVIGIIGVFIPILPTTPFLLLSAACYAKGSKRMYHWFINIHWIGKQIQSYHQGKGISTIAKTISILFLWSTITISMSIVWPNTILLILLFIIALSVTTHILMLKTLKNKNY